MQVVSTAAPAIPRLQDLGGDRSTGAEAQVSGGAGLGDGVADGRRRQSVDERSLSGSYGNHTDTKGSC